MRSRARLRSSRSATLTVFTRFMRPEGLEPSPREGQDPKSCASANSATVAKGSIITSNCLWGQGFRPEKTLAAVSSAIPK